MAWLDYDYNTINGEPEDMATNFEPIKRPGTDGISYVLLGQDPVAFNIVTHLLVEDAATAQTTRRAMRALKGTLQNIKDGHLREYSNVMIAGVQTRDMIVSGYSAALGAQPVAVNPYLIITTWTMFVTELNVDIT